MQCEYGSVFRRVELFEKDFGLEMTRAERHQQASQLARRAVLARSRNMLLSLALRDEEWVLWADIDTLEWPADILTALLRAGKDCIVPNCVLSKGGRSYDLNTWKRPPIPGNTAYRLVPPAWDIQATNLAKMTVAELVSACAEQNGAADNRAPTKLADMLAAFLEREELLGSAGSIAGSSKPEWKAVVARVGEEEALKAVPAGVLQCLRVTAERAATAEGAFGVGRRGVDRSHLVRRSGSGSGGVKVGAGSGDGVTVEELECRPRWDGMPLDKPAGAIGGVTAGNGMGALASGWRGEVPAPRPLGGWQVSTVEALRDPELLMEGYGRTGNLPLSKLRGDGSGDLLVEVDGVGGAMLLIRADLHREGLNFPPYPYRRRIETEGLSMMAKDMGYQCWGMPNLEIVHH